MVSVEAKGDTVGETEGTVLSPARKGDSAYGLVSYDFGTLADEYVVSYTGVVDKVGITNVMV